MKDKNLEPGDLIRFKELADKIKSIPRFKSDEEDVDIDMFKDSGVAELFGQIFTECLSEPYEPASEEEIYEEIVDNFFIIINELGINEFKFFRFISYDYCREIIIDGKEYDLDESFSHDDAETTEALCAIDCLIADLESDDETEVLKNIERMINVRNRS